MGVQNSIIADELFGAYLNEESIECYYDRNILITQEEGYRIQEDVINKKLSMNNEVLKGYKIGLTTLETQKMYGVDEPFYGTLTDRNLVFESELKLEEMSDPKVTEVEVVFLIDDDISTDPTIEEIESKTRIAIGMEIPDSRYINWFRADIPLGVVISDAGAAGKVVVGKPAKYRIDDIDKIVCQMYVDGEKIDEGKSSDVLGSPVNTLMWLVKKLAKKNVNLKKGMVVSSGSMTMPKPIRKGEYKIIFDNIDELNISVI